MTPSDLHAPLLAANDKSPVDVDGWNKLPASRQAGTRWLHRPGRTPQGAEPFLGFRALHYLPDNTGKVLRHAGVLGVFLRYGHWSLTRNYAFLSLGGETIQALRKGLETNPWSQCTDRGMVPVPAGISSQRWYSSQNVRGLPVTKDELDWEPEDLTEIPHASLKGALRSCIPGVKMNARALLTAACPPSPEQTTAVESLVRERGESYGRFDNRSKALRNMVQEWENLLGDDGPNAALPEEQRAALRHGVYMILDKLTRAAFNARHRDNLTDVRGYIECIERSLFPETNNTEN